MCNVFASCHVVVRATDKSLKKRKAEIGLRIVLKPDLSPPVLQRPPVLYFAGVQVPGNLPGVLPEGQGILPEVLRQRLEKHEPLRPSCARELRSKKNFKAPVER